MTDAAKNRAVAKAIGLIVKPYSRMEGANLWLFDDCDRPLMPLDSCIPHRSANQAIEALSKLGPWDWNYEHSTGLASILIYGGVGVGELEGRSTDRDPVCAFCAAAVDAILAAGGRK